MSSNPAKQRDQRRLVHVTKRKMLRASQVIQGIAKVAIAIVDINVKQQERESNTSSTDEAWFAILVGHLIDKNTKSQAVTSNLIKKTDPSSSARASKERRSQAQVGWCNREGGSR